MIINIRKQAQRLINRKLALQKVVDYVEKRTKLIHINVYTCTLLVNYRLLAKILLISLKYILKNKLYILKNM